MHSVCGIRSGNSGHRYPDCIKTFEITESRTFSKTWKCNVHFFHWDIYWPCWPELLACLAALSTTRHCRDGDDSMVIYVRNHYHQRPTVALNSPFPAISLLAERRDDINTLAAGECRLCYAQFQQGLINVVDFLRAVSASRAASSWAG